MPRELSVETAHRQVREDCRELRQKLGFHSSSITPEDVERIRSEGLKLIESKKRNYSYYEIGHHFAGEHVISAVRERVNLTKSEENLLRGVWGRLHYRKEYSRQAQAAEKLAEKGRRGQEIFDAFKSELETTAKNIPLSGSGKGEDMFLNPVVNPLLILKNAFRNFSDMARMKRAWAERETSSAK